MPSAVVQLCVCHGPKLALYKQLGAFAKSKTLAISTSGHPVPGKLRDSKNAGLRRLLS